MARRGGPSFYRVLPTGIVARLVLIFAIVMAPAVAVIAIGELDRYRAAAAAIEEEVGREAARLQASVDHEFRSIENLMTAVARMAAIREYAPRSCDELVYPVLASVRVLSALDVIDRQGHTLCGDTILSRSVPTLDFFVRQRVTFWVGEWTRDRWRPAGILPVATIVYDPFNSAVGVLAGAIDLHSLAGELGDNALPPSSVVAVVDRAARVLVGRPADGLAAGQELPAAWMKVKGAERPVVGVFAGAERLVAFARPAGAPGYPIDVSVGLDTSHLAAAHQRLWRELAFVAFCLAASVALAFALGGVLIKRPIGGLVMAAREWTLGHWGARPRDTGRHSELAVLADAFTKMAEAVAERERELMRAKHAAEQAAAAKSSFLANMSHELRTPLNAIIGFSELMKESVFGPIGARYQDYARDIHASGQHLLSLINDVLDLSKVEAGYVELQEEAVDLGATLHECGRLLAERARRGEVAVELDVPGDLPSVIADALRMRQIVLNLASNAIKFTPAGGSVRLSATASLRDGVRILVADTGIGMKPEDIPLALRPFQQLESALTRRFEGTGLGLPLARELVARHGGELRIESAPGRGTIVEVRLPSSRVLKAAA